jgi:TrmH family RNA methyltransferase
MIYQINSRSNPRLKAFLHHRDKYAIFEGEKLVRDIIKMGFRISILITTSGGSVPDYNQSQIDDVWQVNRSVMKKISAFREGPEIAAAVKPMERKINLTKAGLVLALDGIQDPANAGTIFRCAAAFGVSGIFLTNNCVNPTNSKFLRTAQTAALSVPSQQMDSLTDILSLCDSHRLRIYLTGADPIRNHVKPEAVDLPACVVFGNEGRGLAGELFRRYPAIHVAQSKQIESLNVGISACIILHAIFNRSAT